MFVLPGGNAVGTAVPKQSHSLTQMHQRKPTNGKKSAVAQAALPGTHTRKVAVMFEEKNAKPLVPGSWDNKRLSCTWFCQKERVSPYSWCCGTMRHNQIWKWVMFLTGMFAVMFLMSWLNVAKKVQAWPYYKGCNGTVRLFTDMNHDATCPGDSAAVKLLGGAAPMCNVLTTKPACNHGSPTDGTCYWSEQDQACAYTPTAIIDEELVPLSGAEEQRRHLQNANESFRVLQTAEDEPACAPDPHSLCVCNDLLLALPGDHCESAPIGNCPAMNDNYPEACVNYLLEDFQVIGQTNQLCAHGHNTDSGTSTTSSTEVTMDDAIRLGMMGDTCVDTGVTDITRTYSFSKSNMCGFGLIDLASTSDECHLGTDRLAGSVQIGARVRPRIISSHQESQAHEQAGGPGPRGCCTYAPVPQPFVVRREADTATGGGQVDQWLRNTNKMCNPLVDPPRAVDDSTRSAGRANRGLLFEDSNGPGFCHITGQPRMSCACANALRSSDGGTTPAAGTCGGGPAVFLQPCNTMLVPTTALTDTTPTYTSIDFMQLGSQFNIHNKAAANDMARSAAFETEFQNQCCGQNEQVATLKSSGDFYHNFNAGAAEATAEAQPFTEEEATRAIEQGSFITPEETELSGDLWFTCPDANGERERVLNIETQIPCTCDVTGVNEKGEINSYERMCALALKLATPKTVTRPGQPLYIEGGEEIRATVRDLFTDRDHSDANPEECGAMCQPYQRAFPINTHFVGNLGPDKTFHFRRDAPVQDWWADAEIQNAYKQSMELTIESIGACLVEHGDALNRVMWRGYVDEQSNPQNDYKCYQSANGSLSDGAYSCTSQCRDALIRPRKTCGCNYLFPDAHYDMQSVFGATTVDAADESLFPAFHIDCKDGKNSGADVTSPSGNMDQSCFVTNGAKTVYQWLENFLEYSEDDTALPDQLTSVGFTKSELRNLQRKLIQNVLAGASTFGGALDQFLKYEDFELEADGGWATESQEAQWGQVTAAKASNVKIGVARIVGSLLDQILLAQRQELIEQKKVSASSEKDTLAGIIARYRPELPLYELVHATDKFVSRAGFEVTRANKDHLTPIIPLVDPEYGWLVDGSANQRAWTHRLDQLWTTQTGDNHCNGLEWLSGSTYCPASTPLQSNKINALKENAKNIDYCFDRGLDRKPSDDHENGIAAKVFAGWAQCMSDTLCADLALRNHRKQDTNTDTGDATCWLTTRNIRSAHHVDASGAQCVESYDQLAKKSSVLDDRDNVQNYQTHGTGDDLADLTDGENYLKKVWTNCRVPSALQPGNSEEDTCNARNDLNPFELVDYAIASDPNGYDETSVCDDCRQLRFERAEKIYNQPAHCAKVFGEDKEEYPMCNLIFTAMGTGPDAKLTKLKQALHIDAQTGDDHTLAIALSTLQTHLAAGYTSKDNNQHTPFTGLDRGVCSGNGLENINRCKMLAAPTVFMCAALKYKEADAEPGEAPNKKACPWCKRKDPFALSMMEFLEGRASAITERAWTPTSQNYNNGVGACVPVDGAAQTVAECSARISAIDSSSTPEEGNAACVSTDYNCRYDVSQLTAKTLTNKQTAPGVYDSLLYDNGIHATDIEAYRMGRSFTVFCDQVGSYMQDHTFIEYVNQLKDGNDVWSAQQFDLGSDNVDSLRANTDDLQKHLTANEPVSWHPALQTALYDFAVGQRGLAGHLDQLSDDSSSYKTAVATNRETEAQHMAGHITDLLTNNVGVFGVQPTEDVYSSWEANNKAPPAPHGEDPFVTDARTESSNQKYGIPANPANVHARYSKAIGPAQKGSVDTLKKTIPWAYSWMIEQQVTARPSLLCSDWQSMYPKIDYDGADVLHHEACWDHTSNTLLPAITQNMLPQLNLMRQDNNGEKQSSLVNLLVSQACTPSQDKSLTLPQKARIIGSVLSPDVYSRLKAFSTGLGPGANPSPASGGKGGMKSLLCDDTPTESGQMQTSVGSCSLAAKTTTDKMITSSVIPGMQTARTTHVGELVGEATMLGALGAACESRVYDETTEKYCDAPSLDETNTIDGAQCNGGGDCSMDTCGLPSYSTPLTQKRCCEAISDDCSYEAGARLATPNAQHENAAGRCVPVPLNNPDYLQQPVCVSKRVFRVATTGIFASPRQVQHPRSESILRYDRGIDWMNTFAMADDATDVGAIRDESTALPNTGRGGNVCEMHAHRYSYLRNHRDAVTAANPEIVSTDDASFEADLADADDWNQPFNDRHPLGLGAQVFNMLKETSILRNKPAVNMSDMLTEYSDIIDENATKSEMLLDAVYACNSIRDEGPVVDTGGNFGSHWETDTTSEYGFGTTLPTKFETPPCQFKLPRPHIKPSVEESCTAKHNHVTANYTCVKRSNGCVLAVAGHPIGIDGNRAANDEDELFCHKHIATPTCVDGDKPRPNIPPHCRAKSAFNQGGKDTAVFCALQNTADCGASDFSIQICDLAASVPTQSGNTSDPVFSVGVRAGGDDDTLLEVEYVASPHDDPKNDAIFDAMRFDEESLNGLSPIQVVKIVSPPYGNAGYCDLNWDSAAAEMASGAKFRSVVLKRKTCARNTGQADCTNNTHSCAWIATPGDTLGAAASSCPVAAIGMSFAIQPTNNKPMLVPYPVAFAAPKAGGGTRAYPINKVIKFSALELFPSMLSGCAFEIQPNQCRAKMGYFSDPCNTVTNPTAENCKTSLSTYLNTRVTLPVPLNTPACRFTEGKDLTNDYPDCSTIPVPMCTSPTAKDSKNVSTSAGSCKLKEAADFTCEVAAAIKTPTARQSECSAKSDLQRLCTIAPEFKGGENALPRQEKDVPGSISWAWFQACNPHRFGTDQGKLHPKENVTTAAACSAVFCRPVETGVPIDETGTYLYPTPGAYGADWGTALRTNPLHDFPMYKKGDAPHAFGQSTMEFVVAETDCMPLSITEAFMRCSAGGGCPSDKSENYPTPTAQGTNDGTPKNLCVEPYHGRLDAVCGASKVCEYKPPEPEKYILPAGQTFEEWLAADSTCTNLANAACEKQSDCSDSPRPLKTAQECNSDELGKPLSTHASGLGSMCMQYVPNTHTNVISTLQDKADQGTQAVCMSPCSEEVRLAYRHAASGVAMANAKVTGADSLHPAASWADITDYNSQGNDEHDAARDVCTPGSRLYADLSQENQDHAVCNALIGNRGDGSLPEQTSNWANLITDDAQVPTLFGAVSAPLRENPEGVDDDTIAGYMPWLTCDYSPAGQAGPTTLKVHKMTQECALRHNIRPCTHQQSLVGRFFEEFLNSDSSNNATSFETALVTNINLCATNKDKFAGAVNSAELCDDTKLGMTPAAKALCRWLVGSTDGGPDDADRDMFTFDDQFADLCVKLQEPYKLGVRKTGVFNDSPEDLAHCGNTYTPDGDMTATGCTAQLYNSIVRFTTQSTNFDWKTIQNNALCNPQIDFYDLGAYDGGGGNDQVHAEGALQELAQPMPDEQLVSELRPCEMWFDEDYSNPDDDLTCDQNTENVITGDPDMIYSYGAPTCNMAHRWRTRGWKAPILKEACGAGTVDSFKVDQYTNQLLRCHKALTNMGGFWMDDGEDAMAHSFRDTAPLNPDGDANGCTLAAEDGTDDGGCFGVHSETGDGSSCKKPRCAKCARWLFSDGMINEDTGERFTTFDLERAGPCYYAANAMATGHWCSVDMEMATGGSYYPPDTVAPRATASVPDWLRQHEDLTSDIGDTAKATILGLIDTVNQGSEEESGGPPTATEMGASGSGFGDNHVCHVGKAWIFTKLKKGHISRYCQLDGDATKGPETTCTEDQMQHIVNFGEMISMHHIRSIFTHKVHFPTQLVYRSKKDPNGHTTDTAVSMTSPMACRLSFPPTTTTGPTTLLTGYPLRVCDLLSYSSDTAPGEKQQEACAPQYKTYLTRTQCEALGHPSSVGSVFPDVQLTAKPVVCGTPLPVWADTSTCNSTVNPCTPDATAVFNSARQCPSIAYGTCPMKQVPKSAINLANNYHWQDVNGFAQIYQHNRSITHISSQQHMVSPPYTFNTSYVPHDECATYTDSSTCTGDSDCAWSPGNCAEAVAKIPTCTQHAEAKSRVTSRANGDTWGKFVCNRLKYFYPDVFPNAAMACTEEYFGGDWLTPTYRVKLASDSDVASASDIAAFMLGTLGRGGNITTFDNIATYTDAGLDSAMRWCMPERMCVDSGRASVGPGSTKPETCYMASSSGSSSVHAANLGVSDDCYYMAGGTGTVFDAEDGKVNYNPLYNDQATSSLSQAMVHNTMQEECIDNDGVIVVGGTGAESDDVQNLCLSTRPEFTCNTLDPVATHEQPTQLTNVTANVAYWCRPFKTPADPDPYSDCEAADKECMDNVDRDRLATCVGKSADQCNAIGSGCKPVTKPVCVDAFGDLITDETQCIPLKSDRKALDQTAKGMCVEYQNVDTAASCVSLNVQTLGDTMTEETGSHTWRQIAVDSEDMCLKQNEFMQCEWTWASGTNATDSCAAHQTQTDCEFKLCEWVSGCGSDPNCPYGQGTCFKPGSKVHDLFGYCTKEQKPDGSYSCAARGSVAAEGTCTPRMYPGMGNSLADSTTPFCRQWIPNAARRVFNAGEAQKELCSTRISNNLDITDNTGAPLRPEQFAAYVMDPTQYTDNAQPDQQGVLKHRNWRGSQGVGHNSPLIPEHKCSEDAADSRLCINPLADVMSVSPIDRCIAPDLSNIGWDSANARVIAAATRENLYKKFETEGNRSFGGWLTEDPHSAINETRDYSDSVIECEPLGNRINFKAKALYSAHSTTRFDELARCVPAHCEYPHGEFENRWEAGLLSTSTDEALRQAQISCQGEIDTGYDKQCVFDDKGAFGVQCRPQQDKESFQLRQHQSFCTQRTNAARVAAAIPSTPNCLGRHEGQECNEKSNWASTLQKFEAYEDDPSTADRTVRLNGQGLTWHDWTNACRFDGLGMPIPNCQVQHSGGFCELPSLTCAGAVDQTACTSTPDCAWYTDGGTCFSIADARSSGAAADKFHYSQETCMVSLEAQCVKPNTDGSSRLYGEAQRARPENISPCGHLPDGPWVFLPAGSGCVNPICEFNPTIGHQITAQYCEQPAGDGGMQCMRETIDDVDRTNVGIADVAESVSMAHDCLTTFYPPLGKCSGTVTTPAPTDAGFCRDPRLRVGNRWSVCGKLHYQTDGFTFAVVSNSTCTNTFVDDRESVRCEFVEWNGANTGTQSNVELLNGNCNVPILNENPAACESLGCTWDPFRIAANPGSNPLVPEDKMNTLTPENMQCNFRNKKRAHVEVFQAPNPGSMEGKYFHNALLAMEQGTIMFTWDKHDSPNTPLRHVGDFGSTHPLVQTEIQQFYQGLLEPGLGLPNTFTPLAAMCSLSHGSHDVGTQHLLAHTKSAEFLGPNNHQHTFSYTCHMNVETVMAKRVPPATTTPPETATPSASTPTFVATISRKTQVAAVCNPGNNIVTGTDAAQATCTHAHTTQSFSCAEISLCLSQPPLQNECNCPGGDVTPRCLTVAYAASVLHGAYLTAKGYISTQNGLLPGRNILDLPHNNLQNIALATHTVDAIADVTAGGTTDRIGALSTRGVNPLEVQYLAAWLGDVERDSYDHSTPLAACLGGDYSSDPGYPFAAERSTCFSSTMISRAATALEDCVTNLMAAPATNQESNSGLPWCQSYGQGSENFGGQLNAGTEIAGTGILGLRRNAQATNILDATALGSLLSGDPWNGFLPSNAASRVFNVPPAQVATYGLPTIGRLSTIASAAEQPCVDDDTSQTTTVGCTHHKAANDALLYMLANGQLAGTKKGVFNPTFASTANSLDFQLTRQSSTTQGYSMIYCAAPHETPPAPGVALIDKYDVFFGGCDINFYDAARINDYWLEASSTIGSAPDPLTADCPAGACGCKLGGCVIDESETVYGPQTADPWYDQ